MSLLASLDEPEGRLALAASDDVVATATLERSVDAVRAWVERRNYEGYDPGDGLTSWARPLTFGNLFAERLLQQLVWKAPVNLRPALGVKPLPSTKGRGFMAWGYLLDVRRTGDPDAKARAVACLDWLLDNGSPGRTGLAWGNHFDFSTRSGRMPAHEPTIVWSGLIGQAFLEAYEQLAQPRFLAAAERICDWILSIPREKTELGTCLSYVGYEQSSIHNSSMLGAALLARTWSHTGDARLLDVAREAVRYTCARQKADGSWLYGEEQKYRWVDNFHTGYVLDSLKRYVEATGEDAWRDHLDRGYDYFRRAFFEPSGRPIYYPGNRWPVDIQCAAQAIDTFAYFGDEDDAALAMGEKVALWTIANMQGRSGAFHYRQYPMLNSRTPYFHWGQATMFKALNHLLLRMALRQRRAG